VRDSFYGFRANLERVRRGATLIFAFLVVPAPVFAQTFWSAALVARHDIDLRGNGVYTDSYDSSNPAKSLAGNYSLATYSGDKGDIATGGGVTNSISIGNAHIYGKVHTGPDCGVSIGPYGAVGTHAWQASHTGAEPGYVLQDANFTFPDTTFPNTSSYLGLPPGSPCAFVTSSLAYTTNGVSNSSTYPNPPPAWGAVVTNNNPATVSTYPNPVPPGLTTNTIPVTSSNLPNPVVAGTVTNISTFIVTTSSFPAPGSYTGTIITNNMGAGHPKTYTYNFITGITFSYNTYTYTYPVYTYSYSTFSTNTIYITNTYDYILSANNSYVAASLSGKKVLINGPNIVLALQNGMDGTESLTWASGANVLVYSGGTSITVSGNGYINPIGAGASLIIYAAPTVTLFTLHGNGQFTGVIVAPNADVVLQSGGTSNEDYVGSLMVNSVSANGHFSFHFDESLPGLLMRPVAAMLNSPVITGGNQFQFAVAGVPGFNYRVEASTNLLDWTPLLTNTSPFIFVDSDAPNFARRYYRSVYIP
jgi:hypothetical protein